MPATVVIPAVTGNYPSNLLIAAPYDWDAPPNDPQRISGGITWGGGEVSGGATLIQYQAGITKFDKIRGMFVDNTQSGADVTFYFPDTQFEFIVNAGEKDYFQVATNQTQVIAIALTAIASDKTFFHLFNFSPPPLASNRSLTTNVAALAGVDLTTTAVTNIIALGTNGTIRGMNVNTAAILGGAAAGASNIVLRDGALKVIWSGTVSAAATTAIPASVLIDQAGLNVRFTNGLNAVVTVGGTAFATGHADVNVYFTQP